MLDWEKLKLFYQVATAGSITTAAERLNLSQPALSRSILSLENRLKTKLFERHKRGISLTPLGESLFRGAHRMYIESRNIEQNLLESHNEIDGELTVATTPAIAAAWLMKYIPSFLEKHPDIRFKIVAYTDEDPDLHTDITIMTYIPLQPTLIQNYLTTFQMRLYASQKYIDTFGKPETPEDLDYHRLVSFNAGHTNPMANVNWILKVGHKGGGMRTPFMECNTASCILKAAQMGIGIVELSKGYAASEGVYLVEILPDIQGPAVDIFYTFPENKKNIKKIQAFFEHISTASERKPQSIPQEKMDGFKLAALG